MAGSLGSMPLGSVPTESALRSEASSEQEPADGFADGLPRSEAMTSPTEVNAALPLPSGLLDGRDGGLAGLVRVASPAGEAPPRADETAASTRSALDGSASHAELEPGPPVPADERTLVAALDLDGPSGAGSRPDPYEPNGPGTVVDATIPDPPSIDAAIADGLSEDQIEQYRDLAREFHVAWEVIAVVDVLVNEKEDELTALAQEEAEREAVARAEDDARARQEARGSGDDWAMPLAPGGYRLSARFGAAGRLWSSGRHTGQDFAATAGSPIRAVRSGIVRVAGRGAKSGWAGMYVEIDHSGGWTSLYAHASRVAELFPGDEVSGGEVIGWVGSTGNSTGPHLHLELHQDGRPVDPMSVLTDAAARSDAEPEAAPEPEPVTVEPVALGIDLEEVAAALDERLPRKRRLMDGDDYFEALVASVPELDAAGVLEVAQNWRVGLDRTGDDVIEHETSGG